MYIEILCEMLDSDYTDVIETASSAIIYSVARARKSHIKELLELIENKLSSDTFRHFTQFYFKLLNELDYSSSTDDTLELLITLNSNVFKWNLDSFYFTSDIRVLIDIYIRAFHNCEPSSKPLLLCLDGVYNIIRWKQYGNKDKLDQYKSSELIQELQDLTKIVTTASNEFKEYETKQNEGIYMLFISLHSLCHYIICVCVIDYTQEQLAEVLKLIEKIQNKIDVIIETLQLIGKGEFDYDAAIEQSIKLPIDISQYALDTKSMSTLQKELQNYCNIYQKVPPTEWIEFLSDDDYEVYNRLCLLSNRLLTKENTKFDDDDEEHKDEDQDQDELDEEMLFPLSTLSQLLATLASLDPKAFWVF